MFGSHAIQVFMHFIGHHSCFIFILFSPSKSSGNPLAGGYGWYGAPCSGQNKMGGSWPQRGSMCHLGQGTKDFISSFGMFWTCCSSQIFLELMVWLLASPCFLLKSETYEWKFWPLRSHYHHYNADYNDNNDNNGCIQHNIHLLYLLNYFSPSFSSSRYNRCKSKRAAWPGWSTRSTSAIISGWKAKSILLLPEACCNISKESKNVWKAGLICLMIRDGYVRNVRL